MKIALVTDSTSGLTAAEVKENDIHVVPIPIMIGNDQYLDGINITAKKLFELEDAGADFPKTSQPSIGECMELFAKLHDQGYEGIIAITLSSGISGFYQSLMTIAEEHPEYNLHPYDSEITVRLQGNLVLAAAEMIRNGLSLEDIIKHLDSIRDTIKELFVVDDLNNLSRGGRLSNAGAFIGTMLHIKPLLKFDESGKIIAFEKIRSMKRAVLRIEKLALEETSSLVYKDKLTILVLHSNDPNQAEQIKAFAEENFPGLDVQISEFSPVIATHLGNKSLAIAWMVDYRKLDLSK